MSDIQESIINVLSGMDGSRNRNYIFNLEKILVILTFSSEVRRDRDGLKCFKSDLN